jgi:hypothetical protein
VFYIARKIKGVDAARQMVDGLVSACQVCPIDLPILQSALTLPMRDYEDAVQHVSAVASQMDALVTRDTRDYAGATLPMLTPQDFLDQLNRQAR